MDKNTKKLLSVKELAETIGMSTTSVYQKQLMGEIPAIRFGRTIRFDLTEVLAFGKKKKW